VKERLVDLINKYPCMSTAEDCFMESISSDLADYLLENGVLVPPCKVGQTIYRNIIDKPLEFNVIKIEVFEDEMLFIDDVGKLFCISDIGKSVFLAKEEAEQALKGGVQ
jgi:hypothetical protein